MKTLVGIIFSAFIGLICGLLFGFIVSGTFGWLIAVLMFFFSLDVIFNGTKDGM